MLDPIPSAYTLVSFLFLTLLYAVLYLGKNRPNFFGSFQIFWLLLLVIILSEWVSFSFALWILAFLSFYVLREFISLVQIRIEDRLGIFISYLAIPFMFYLIYIDWYGMFIITIPVYFFLLVPFSIALGRNPTGIVFSVGVINFGLYFYVFCLGHFGYLVFFSERMATLLIVIIAIVDFIYKSIAKKHVYAQLAIAVIFSVSACLISAEWSGIPYVHSLALGFIIPLIAYMGHLTLNEFEKDLGIRTDKLQTGRGKYIDATKLYLFTAPVVFHYLRWFMEWGDL